MKTSIVRTSRTAARETVSDRESVSQDRRAKKRLGRAYPPGPSLAATTSDVRPKAHVHRLACIHEDQILTHPRATSHPAADAYAMRSDRAHN